MFGFKPRSGAAAGGAAQPASSSSSSSSGSSSSSSSKHFVETDAFRERRGLVSPVSSSSSVDGPAPASPTRFPAPRWVWTEAGFGVVLHESRAAVEEARARGIADSLAPHDDSSDAGAIAQPQPQQAATTILADKHAAATPSEAATGAGSSVSGSGSGSSSSSSVPDAPPLSPPPPSSSPSTSLSQFLSILKSSLPAGGAAKNPNALTLPELPPLAVDQVAASVMDDVVAVHLLPHHSRAMTPPSATLNPAAATSASSSSGSSSSPAPTSSASFVANPPTVIYTPSHRVHSHIRVHVRTFLDLQSVTPKPKSEDDAAASSSSSPTVGKDPSSVLKNLLGAEIRLRKEKADRERMARESGVSTSAASASTASSASAEADREVEEKRRAAAARLKATGPAPQDFFLDVAVNESIRGLIQRVQDFYADYGAELDADSVRLVCNGVEFSKCVANSVTAPVTATGTAAAAAGTGAAAASSAAALDPLDPKTPLLERLGRLLSSLGGAIDSPLGSFGSGGAMGRAASLESVHALVSAAKHNGGKLDSSVASMLNEAMWAQMGASPPSGAGAAAAARAAAAANKGPSPLERERFYRSHTMLAECGLVPARGAAVLPADAAASASAPSGSSSSSSSSSSPSPAPPVFNVLLVYDELSRFSLDTSSLPPEVSLTADGLGCCMDKADNKWQTIRASAPFAAGRHSWKVRMERCAGGNLFLGVCTSAMKLNNYLGHDANSWGYYGCGNIYRSGSSSSYGSSYRTGDVLTLHLDMDRRTLSFDKNGQALGVAFNDLPDHVYPAFSLYTKNDCFQIIEFGSF